MNQIEESTEITYPKFYIYFELLSSSTGLKFNINWLNTEEKAIELCKQLDNLYYNPKINDSSYLSVLQELEELTLDDTRDIDSDEQYLLLENAIDADKHLDLFYQLTEGTLISRIKESLLDTLLPKSVEINFKKKIRITTLEGNDKLISLKSSNPDDIIALLNSYRRIAIKAPTGSGKSRLLIKMVATSGPKDYGIILTNSNFDAFEFYEDVLALNPEMKGQIRVFNSDANDYDDIKADVTLLNKCRWIICWSGRMFDGDITVLFDIMFSNRPYSQIKSARKYIFSDECVKVNKLRYIDHNKLLYLCDLTSLDLLDLAKEYSKEKVEHLLDDLDKLDDIIYDHIINKKSLSNELLIKLSKLRGTFKLPSLYQLRIEIQRFKYLIKSLGRHPDKLSRLFLNPKASIRYRLNINDIDDDYYIAVFDATAHIMYRDSNLFKVIDYGIAPKDIVQLYGLNWNVPNRKDSTEKYNEFFSKIESGEYSFVDNSLIIWFKYGNNESHFIKEKLSKILYNKGLTKFKIDHFNGTRLFSCNDLTELENVYILGYFEIAKGGAKEYSVSTGSNIGLDEVFLVNCEQGIGRTDYRNLIRVNVDGKVINVYLVNTIPSNCVAELVDYYRSDWKSTRLIDNPTMLVDAYLASQKFHSQGSGIKSNTLKCINYIAKDIYKEYSMKELLDVGEFKVRKMRQLNSTINFYKDLGININITK